MPMLEPNSEVGLNDFVFPGDRRHSRHSAGTATLQARVVTRGLN